MRTLKPRTSLLADRYGWDRTTTPITNYRSETDLHFDYDYVEMGGTVQRVPIAKNASEALMHRLVMGDSFERVEGKLDALDRQFLREQSRSARQAGRTHRPIHVTAEKYLELRQILDRVPGNVTRMTTHAPEEKAEAALWEAAVKAGEHLVIHTALAPEENLKDYYGRDAEATAELYDAMQAAAQPLGLVPTAAAFLEFYDAAWGKPNTSIVTKMRKAETNVSPYRVDLNAWHRKLRASDTGLEPAPRQAHPEMQGNYNAYVCFWYGGKSKTYELRAVRMYRGLDEIEVRDNTGVIEGDERKAVLTGIFKAYRDGLIPL